MRIIASGALVPALLLAAAGVDQPTSEQAGATLAGGRLEEAAALAESCLKGNLGAGIDAPLDYFDESPSRIVVSTSQPDALAKLGVPMTRLGSVGGQRLIIPGVGDLSLDDMRSAYEGGLA